VELGNTAAEPVGKAFQSVDVEIGNEDEDEDDFNFKNSGADAVADDIETKKKGGKVPEILE